VGGAERSARRRRQAQSTAGKTPAVASHKSGERRNVVIGVAVVVLLLGAVLAGVIYTSNEKDATEGQNIAAKSTTELDDAASGAAGASADYPVKRDGATVVVGEDSAKVTLDVYEDFLCPVCRAFEAEFGDDLTKHVKDGTVKLRYHMLPMLNDRSDPPGYSMDSANAGLCAADAGKFPAFHVSLFDAQPEEGARGWDKQQLAKLGKDLGITAPTFKSCVESGKYGSALQAELDKVRTAEYLQQEINGQKGFGTPTIAKGQQVVDTADPRWLDKVLGGAS
jgi:protein-disulfide isomerase